MLRKLLHQHICPQPVSESAVPPELKFKIVFVEFYDRTNNNSGSFLSGLLKNAEGLDVSCLIPDFDQSFLNLESRNFFDLIDRGKSLLTQTHADVLVWGYKENGCLRLNFQTPHQYENDDSSFVCLLDSMYIPDEAFDNDNQFPPALLDLLTGTIVSAVNRTEKEYKIFRKYLLKKIISRISQIDSAQSLGLAYMPYILNQLGLIYMSVAADGKNKEDFKTISNLFNTALKYKDQIFDPTHFGCLHLHMGQLNDYASVYTGQHPGEYFRAAIRYYQSAQKYFGKYTYPYDYGHICYKLSGLYYNYWKQTEDLQALRDSVSRLRECERIFTQAQFPDFWGRIQGNLGYLLHNLGHLTHSPDICRLAVNAYRNQQKIITEKRQSLHWAQIQEKIAEIYYLEGKISNNLEALQEALGCYHDALYIFETAKHTDAVRKTQAGIAKTLQIIQETNADEPHFSSL